MAINGLLTKVIFDHNPTNDYYVEESFPLDWMFPHLSPYGIMMKINRQTLPEVTEEMVRRDHEFWSAYASRLTGNWLNYDTSVTEIANFVDKVYIQHDYTGFTGNRRYIRDEQAQKSFSKLRTAIGGIYAWRVGQLVGTPTPPEYVATGAAQQRMVKEADFAYRQAFVFCPFSPEITYRYVQFLANVEGRFADAHTVAATCLKFDPNNTDLRRMERQLSPASSAAETAGNPGLAALEKLEKQVQDDPGNHNATLALAQVYVNTHRNPRALELLDKLIAATNTEADLMGAVGKLCNDLHDLPRLELVIKRLIQIQPNIPEQSYELAQLQVLLQKTPEAMSNLNHALEQSDARFAHDANAMNLRARAPADPIFASVTNLPDFQTIVSPPK
jgi:tetratricopeptide (TPR) repeat protein